MKKFSLLFIALVAITSAKADLVVDSLGTIHMGRGIINVAELGSTDIANGHIDNATIDNANIEKTTAIKINTDTINAQYANLQHVHFGQTLATTASFQILNTNNANISNLNAINSNIDSISSKYMSIANSNDGIIIRPNGIINANSNEALIFDTGNGAFLTGINNNYFLSSRIGNTFSIGSSKNNLYLYNTSQQANSTAITATVESNNASFFVGLNRASNIYSFQVTANGTVYARSGFVNASDADLKENIQSVANALEGIRNINPVTYNFKSDNENNNQPSQRNTTNNNNTRTRYGFIAQELEEIFPNVVYNMPSGEKGIAYQELIPILVSAIQEQQELIDYLAEEIETLQQPATEQRRQAPASVQDALADASAVLMQNTPNPFNQATEIGYRLPEGTATAMIMLCDMNGKMLQTYPLPVNTTAGTLTIQAGSYTPGMYLYTLLIDGMQIDTKQMIILAH